MTSRTNVTLSETTTYAWDEDNRLTLVTLPDTSTVAYTWDVIGRMLSRTDTAGTTTFVWDGWNSVQETDHDGNVTLYNMPGPRDIGTLMSFSRNGSMFQAHADALGSIRKVTDSSGSVAATFDYDGYGNQLASTSDSVPDGGFMLRFVGAYGVRWDAGIGLYYVRNRWYDSTLQRFIGRDSLRATNRYKYAANSPQYVIDPTGLAPQVSSDVQQALPNIQNALNLVGQEITLGPCSGDGYNFTADQMAQFANDLQNILNSNITIAIGDPKRADADTYAYHDPGALYLIPSKIKELYKTAKGAINHAPPCPGNPNARNDAILAYVLAHEATHEYIDRQRAGLIKGIGPDWHNEPDAGLDPAGFKAAHNFLTTVLNCLLPQTKGIYSPPETVPGVPIG